MVTFKNQHQALLRDACPDDDALRDLLASENADQDAAPAMAHLDTCEACCRRLEQLAGDHAFLQRASQLLKSNSSDNLRYIPPLQAGQSTWSEQAHASQDTHDEDALLAFLQPCENEASLGRLGRYEILSVLGRGGMGMVLKARDPGLDRLAAIKVMASPLALAPGALPRLLREARAVAAVDGEHTVDIYEVQSSGDVPYLVMEYVDGCSLQELINQGPLAIGEVLRFGGNVARGLAAAHRRGLIHRDVKPANILLDQTLSQAKIGDFGLARAIDDKSLTRQGTLTGTPEYMSPEQASGEAVDHRTDLFSLGCVLYAMCAARPPFLGDGSLEVLRAIREEQPKPLTELRPDAPPQLVQAIGKLLEKRPDDRHASAAEVADELERIAVNPLAEPQTAQPAKESAARPTRRHGMLIGLAASLLLIAVMVTAQGAGVIDFTAPAAAMLGMGDDEVALVAREGEEQPADEAKADGDKPARVQIVGRNDLLKEAIQKEKDALREEASPLLIRKLVGHQGPVTGLAFTPDGSQILSCSGWPTGDRTLRLWDAKSGEMVRNFDTSQMPKNRGISGAREAPGELQCLAISEDGSIAVTGANGGAMCVWSLATGKLLRQYDGHLATVYGVAISADGRRVLSCGRNAAAHYWKLETAETVSRLEGNRSWVRSVAISPDGRQGLTGGYDGTLRLWDLESGEQLKEVANAKQWVWSCAFSPDGKSAASASGSEVVLRELASGKELRRLKGHSGPVTCVAFSPDGRQLATCSYDRTVRLWHVATGRQEEVFLGHRDWVWRVSFSPDGRTLASAGGGREDPINGTSPGIDFDIRMWKVP